MTNRTMPMSRFIQNYKPQLDEVALNDDVLVLEQRAGRPSFILETERRANAHARANVFIAAALGSLVGDSALEHAFAEKLAASLPWVAFLPDEDRSLFVDEIVGTLSACASIGRYTAFVDVIDDWRNTAEIHSDPRLAASLSVDIDEPLGLEV